MGTVDAKVVKDGPSAKGVSLTTMKFISRIPNGKTLRPSQRGNSFIFEPRGSGELGLLPHSKVDRVEHDAKQICRNEAQLPGS